MLAPSIQISNASLTYANKIVFANLNLTLNAGKWLGLLGPSGVGKTSLLRMMAGLTVDEETVTGNIITSNYLPLSDQVAYMAQTDLLLPWLTVRENVLLKSTLAPKQQANHTTLEQANLLLEKVGLASVSSHYPAQLSGGMRQRAALARTLMDQKPVVLMDEPFSALDAITRYKLQALAAELLQGKTVLFITHDPIEALRLADEIYLLQGDPVQLKKIASFDTALPRELDDPTVIEWQMRLIKELASR